jgi:HEAT repeat protein
MSDEKTRAFFIGPIGPIPIVSEDDPRRVASNAAARVAQAAVDCDDLIALVLNHPDAIVRMEAVPRLKARFPNDSRAHDALMRAVTDGDGAVRCSAVYAVADLALPQAGDLLAIALNDTDADVRFFAAMGLQQLGDERAPDDPEAFAYRHPTGTKGR